MADSATEPDASAFRHHDQQLDHVDLVVAGEGEFHAFGGLLDRGLTTASPDRTRTLYGGTVAAEFGPLWQKAFRRSLIDEGLCRQVVNRQVRCTPGETNQKEPEAAARRRKLADTARRA